MSLDTSFAKGLVENYANKQWQFTNAEFAQDGIKDSRCVWLSITDIQNFFAEIQQQNPLGKVTNGVRIYFGAYSAVAPSPVSADYNRLHALVMIPTYQGKDGKNYDYDAATGTSDFANLATVTAMNHGTMTPPPFHIAGPDNMYEQGNLFMKYTDNQP